ncbi:hypothetical protein KIH74_22850 [Kineosporia sp. J2-2]|uniref:Uncharacterized protein n=1 Tax=Kineosporia corallincola TaxID=2835133 RepID=A0ABS5TL09_9ACTN|nr:hypothetical protein [Kineosporia corallincola]MBT0771798.1 hypothetical protein [Kineosporia corallincola]
MQSHHLRLIQIVVPPLAIVSLYVFSYVETGGFPSSMQVVGAALIAIETLSFRIVPAEGT